MTLESFALGFIAGEGSFYIAVKHRSNENVTFTPSFALKVSEKEIVGKIAEDIGIGLTYSRPDEPDSLTWKINSVDECLELAELIRENSNEYWESTHKAEQFEIWREALLMKDEGVETAEEKKRMVDLSFDIAKTNTRKISKDEWYDRIEEYHKT